MNRRKFLKRVGQSAAGLVALTGAPMIVPAEVVGRGKRPSPSNRINMAAIGNGWMGASNVSGFLNLDNVQLIAVCDVDSNHLKEGVDKINGRYGNKDCRAYEDFRELYEKEALDAVMIALPDHWHAIPAIWALKRGIDVYGEKPLTRFVTEGRAICDAVARYGRVWQTGSWQRSRPDFRHACELVLNGRLGKVKHVDVGYSGGLIDFDKVADQTKYTDPPRELNYDLWLGPAPYEPYCRARTHKNWRLLLDYGGGLLTDWVAHHLDIAHWGLGLDRTGPIKIEGKGNFVPGLYDVPEHFDVLYTYENDITIRITDKLENGARFHGEDGKWVFVTRGKIDANPKSLLTEEIGPGEHRLLRSTDHYQNFIDCVISRNETLTPAEIAHRSASVGNLGLISILTGRTLEWNPKTETFKNDNEANRLLGRSLRAPWTLSI